ncbi:MAG: tetratricopeptide repeat protein, partial [Candidatus Latescibacteria bacterium]|nr:tetratricopeptide repeat protein [Candidatus Latescibacterota bacterium]
DTIQAISFYEHAIEQDPQNPTPHVNLGLIQASNNEFKQALSAYQSALNLSPNDPTVLTNLIALYTSAGQYDDALELCRTLEEAVPDATQPKQLTGAVAYAAGQFELALVAYQNALDLNPKNIEVLQGIASTHEALDNTKAAQEHWQTWLDLVGDDPTHSEAAAHVTEHLKALATLTIGTGQGLFP